MVPHNVLGPPGWSPEPSAGDGPAAVKAIRPAATQAALLAATRMRAG